MERNQSIDFLKLVSIFFVVIGHNPFNSKFGFAMDAIVRFSVPIFFMTTGYFLTQSKELPGKVKRQIIKLIKYYILYEGIYVFYNFIVALCENNLQSFKYSLLLNIKFILISPNIGEHLWYLVNIIWVLVIIYIFYIINKLKILFLASIVLNLLGILISNLSLQIFHQALPLGATRNFLFYGLFYVMLGMYIRKINVNNIKLGKNSILIFSILLCLLQVAERYFWRELFNSQFREYFITTIFACTGIYIFTLKCNFKNSYIEKLAKYSMPIYFLHVLVIYVLDLFIVQVMKLNLVAIKSTVIGNFLFIILTFVSTCVLYKVYQLFKQNVLIKLAKPIKI